MNDFLVDTFRWLRQIKHQYLDDSLFGMSKFKIVEVAAMAIITFVAIKIIDFIVLGLKKSPTVHDEHEDDHFVKNLQKVLRIIVLLLGIISTVYLVFNNLHAINPDQVKSLAGFAGFLMGGLILGRALRYPLSRWIEKLTPQDDHVSSQKIARSFERLSFLLIFAIVLNMGAVDVLNLGGWIGMRMSWVNLIFLTSVVTMTFLQIVDVALLGLKKKWNDTHSGVDELLINFIRKGVRIFVIVIAILVTAQQMGIQVTSVLTGLGIGGAAIALGSQGLIANIIGTAEIVADRLFHVGDRIQFDQFDGFVTDVGLRSTKIRALSGEQIIVPNKKMAEVQIRNHSRNGLVRTKITLGITYSTNHDQIRTAMKILEDIFKARTDVESHQIYLKDLADYSVEIEVAFWGKYSQSAEYNQLIGQLHLEIKKQFDLAGINFAFPTQTLHIADIGVPGGKPAATRSSS